MHGWRSFSGFHVSRHPSWGNLVALRARKEESKKRGRGISCGTTTPTLDRGRRLSGNGELWPRNICIIAYLPSTEAAAPRSNRPPSMYCANQSHSLASRHDRQTRCRNFADERPATAQNNRECGADGDLPTRPIFWPNGTYSSQPPIAGGCFRTPTADLTLAVSAIGC